MHHRDPTLPEARGAEVWSAQARTDGPVGMGAIKEGSTRDDTKYAAESSVVTPEIDLGGYKEATVSFSHAVNYAQNPSEKLERRGALRGQDDEARGLHMAYW